MDDKVTWKNCEEEHNFSWEKWNPRIIQLASMIDKSATSVLDLGAGGMLLKKYLPENVKYYPVDYASRCEQTIVCDFNKHEFPDIYADVVFISGCLEYVKDVEWFLQQVAEHCKQEIVISYNPTEFSPDSELRRRGPWVNNLSSIKLTRMIHKLGFILISQREFRSDEIPHQMLYKFYSSKPSLLPEYQLCTGCGTCKNVCPRDAIAMQPDLYGFFRPVFNSQKCINCRQCLKMCPSLHPRYNNLKEPECYAVCAEDAIREKSSSGGVFTLLADEIFRQGGSVCGAAWTEDFHVEHVIIHDSSDLNRLSHSKYLQSDVGNCYIKIKEMLDKDETVLFSGCPCQVAGLNAYLGKNYDCLYTIDLLCHYVPSPTVFQKYLHENFDVSNLKSFDFRSKVHGWDYYTQLITIKDGSEIIRDIHNDLFQRGFHPRLFMNRTCEFCQFANLPRQGDITIGDFWESENRSNNFSDGKGTSSVLLNNDKGRELYEKIQEDCKLTYPISLENIKKNRITQHYSVHPGHDRFIDLMSRLSFNKAVDYALNGKYDIGIVGDWGVENFGANLTYYALFRVVRDLGYEPLMIERPADAPWKPNGTPACFRNNPYRPYDLAPIYPTKQEMRQLSDRCNAFLVGSDQLFNDSLYHAFGEFITLDWSKNNKKRIAYGASFGFDCFNGTDETRVKMSFFMKQFDAFSVREKSGVDLAKKEFGVSAEWVLDPVFLCRRSYYDDLAEKSKNCKYESQKHIGVYMIDPNREKASAVQFVMDQLHLPCYAISDAAFSHDKVKQDWEIETDQNVFCEDLLRNIKDCDFLITDSFHGVCFAIIYQKSFIAIANESRGTTRFTSILDLLGLTGKLVYSPKEIQRRPDLLERINYDSVNDKLNVAKEKSLLWLKNALQAEKEIVYSHYDIIEERIDTEELRQKATDDYFSEVKQRFINVDKFAESTLIRLNGFDQYFLDVNKHLQSIDGLLDNSNQKFTDLDEHFEMIENQMDAIGKSITELKSYVDYVNSRTIRYQLRRNFPKLWNWLKQFKNLDN